MPHQYCFHNSTLSGGSVFVDPRYALPLNWGRLLEFSRQVKLAVNFSKRS